jgi:para-nitrobenzyl esterase
MPKKAPKRSWRSGILSGKANSRHFALVACLALSLTGCHSQKAPADSGEVPAVSAAGSPVLIADGEMLQGQWGDEDQSVAVFKGIPYAAPPVGDLRWRPPAQYSPREGLQAASQYGPACIQDPDHVPAWYRYLAKTFEQDPSLVPRLEPISEDCLHLNVWTANLGGDESWPVLVWIHGGANNSGSPTELPYDGSSITRKGVVVVSFNYRLNVFGFLAHPALTAESDQASSGNYGLLDQIAALQWIQRNIAAFGGDPERVTIFGESAGAANVAYLMSSPLATGLFHRGLMQSGGYSVSEFRTLADLEAMGEGLAEEVGADESTDVLATLRASTPEDLLHTALEVYSGWNSVPNVDGWVLEEAPGRVFERGDQIPVPLLVGFNSDEWTTLGHYSPDQTLDGLHESFRTSYGDLADRAIELYPASTDEEAAVVADSWNTDSTFACPSRFIADRVARASNNVFFYVFSRSIPGPGGDKLGAYHGAETAYVMDNLAQETWVPRDEHDQYLADLMSDYWVQFASSGDPNGGDRLPWPGYDPGSREYLEFGDQIVVGFGIRTDRCDFFDEIQSLRLNASD